MAADHDNQRDQIQRSTQENEAVEKTAPRNRLLSSMSVDDFAILEPHLERVYLEVNDVIAEPGESVTHVIFPEDCVISIVNYMSDGVGVEVATTGNEGMAGLPAYLEADASEGKTFCQLAGSAMRTPASVLIAAAISHPSIRQLLNRYTQAYMTQVAQNAACNRLHNIEQRCARWLLMTHDRTPGDTVPLKQEFLALMLGVRRVGVTLAMRELQESGLIRYSRGVIRVIDREGLELAACECYGIVRRHFNRLLPG